MKASLTQEQQQVYEQLMGSAVFYMMLNVGVFNNAAWAACLDAMDHIRRHPRYNTQITGGTTPGKEFRRCFDMLKDYERRLKYGESVCTLYAGTLRVRYTCNFFSVKGAMPEVRKVYGAGFTSSDYYEKWSCVGFTAYQRTKPFFTSLVNKLRLAYLNHGDAQPDIIGWAAAAKFALDLAADTWDYCINGCMNFEHATPFRVGRDAWRKFFACFNIRSVADRWSRCIDDLDPDINIDLTELELSNITAGYNQLQDQWQSLDTIFGSHIQTAADFADLFRTNGEMKKQQREWAELKAEIERTGQEMKAGKEQQP